MKLAQFMATPFGRGLRIVIGLALVATGIALIIGSHPVWGVISGLVGLLLAVVGTANVCPLAVVAGGPFRGKDAAA